VALLFWAVCLAGLWSLPLVSFSLFLSWVLSFLIKFWQGLIIEFLLILIKRGFGSHERVKENFF
jgi:hypothetical protein